MQKIILILGVLFVVSPPSSDAQSTREVKSMSLSDCIDYATVHNLSLQSLRNVEKTAEVDVTEAQSAWLPRLTANFNEGLTATPFSSGTQGAKRVTLNGSVGLGAEWTAWNGRLTSLNLQSARLQLAQNRVTTEASTLSLHEEIAKYYVNAVYLAEALQTSRTLLAADSTLLKRAQVMKDMQQISEADLSQIEAQVCNSHYEVVNLGTQLAEAHRNLESLLQIPAGQSIKPKAMEIDSSYVLSELPTLQAIYANALSFRPELQSAQLGIEQSKVATRAAKAARHPEVKLTASILDSHLTPSTSLSSQLKRNFSLGAGVSVTIPIFDNRKVKSAIERARIEESSAQIQYAETQRELYDVIHNYHLSAGNAQEKYKSSIASASALQISYSLLTEQFRLGLKNIAELLNTREQLLTARLQVVQDKYTALLNRTILGFYGGETLKL